MSKHLRAVVAAMVVGGSILAGGGAARGEDPNAILDLLEHKGLITHEEADKARTYYEKQQKEAVVKYDKTKMASWIDQMKWSGDLRLRAEDFVFEDSLHKADRLRYRLRARLGLETKLQDWADIGLRIGTGDSGDPNNGLSQNTTLNDTFRKKPINLDLAYVTIHPPMAEWVKVTGGKMLTPMWHPVSLSPMVYDPDVTPEGLAEQFNYKLDDKGQWHLWGNFGQFTLKELSADSNDVYLFDFQGGVEAKFDPIKAKLGGGYFVTHNLGNTNYKTGDSSNNGNSVNAAGTSYLGDFNVVSGLGEVAWTIGPEPFLGTPCVLTVGGEYLDNMSGRYEDAHGDQTTGWAAQAVFGKAEKKGQWLVGYEYKRLTANTTFDGIVDDDFGNGGTDRKGHIVYAAYNVLDWWQLGFKTFITEKISHNTGAHTQAGVPGEDQLRVQMDTLFKF